mgnify:CR=1 FL=1
MNESLHPLARMHVTNLKRKDNNQREEKKKKLTLKRRKDYKVINSVKITSLRKGSNTSHTVSHIIHLLIHRV